MLVLSRKCGQTITIGDHITIRVNAIRGAAVQIAIDAPRGMLIVRGELSADTVDSLKDRRQLEASIA